MSSVDDAINRWKPQGADQSPMRTLVLDIETCPTEAAIWQLKQHGYVGTHQILEPGYMMSWAAKWLGNDRVMFASTYHDGVDTMLDRLHQLLTDADAVITYNGVQFDIPVIEWEFMRHEYLPPAPWTDIDLIKSVRKSRKLSNKLDYVCRELGVTDGKIDSGGMETWLGCKNGDPQAWALMKKYNREDVRITEAVYWRILPWLRCHPTVSMYAESCDQGIPLCGFCGSGAMVQAGVDVKKTARYSRYQCQGCGGWNRARLSDPTPKPTARTIR